MSIQVRRRSRLRLLSTCLPVLAALGSAVGPSAMAAQLRVGTGTGCVYATIADAVAQATANGTTSDLILVKTSPAQTISAPIAIDLNVAGTVEIVGGFGQCTDALPIAGQRTSITVPSSNAFQVQNAGASTRTFTLQQVTLISGASGGRLVDVSGRALVNIDDALLSSGKGTDGGNIRMTGPNVTLFITGGATIYNGTATGSGGGVHCSGGGLVLLDDGGISDNDAVVAGGGVYLDGCSMNAFPGDSTVACPSGSNRGIVCNTAGAGAPLGSGGGVYATNGATVNFVGGSAAQARLAQNSADYGGGLFATGAATDVEFRDSDIVQNSGFRGGGGVALDNGAQLTIRATLTSCGNSPDCSRLANNGTASIVGENSLGGGVWVSGGADANIRRTRFFGNSAPTGGGAAIAVEGAGSTALLEGDVIYAHSNRPVYSYDGGSLTAAFVTAWGNNVGSSATFNAFGTGSNIAVFSSVTLDDRTFDVPGVNTTFGGDCIVTRSLDNFPAPPDPGSFEVAASAAAVLADPASGSERLRADSPAIDFCDTFRYTPVDSDIHGETRGADNLMIPNTHFGTYDLGAAESIDLFFGNFEVGNCTLWSANVGC
jgi:hypothetical protein